MTADRGPRSGTRRSGRFGPSLPVLVVGFAVLTSVLVGAAGGAVAGSNAGVASVDGPGAGTHQIVGPGSQSPAGGLAGPLVQQADDGSGIEICERNASTFVDTYNEQVERVPGFVRNRIQKSNIYLAVEDDPDSDYTMVTNEEGQVVKYSAGKPRSASLRVETDCATFQEITDSSDPGQTFRQAYAEDRVRLIGLGPVNFVFFEAVDRVDDPISWAIFLFVLLLIVVILYVLYRRLAIYYRSDDEAEEDEPPESAPDAPTAGEPAEPAADQGQVRAGSGAADAAHQAAGESAGGDPPGTRQGGGPDEGAGGQPGTRQGRGGDARGTAGPQQGGSDGDAGHAPGTGQTGGAGGDAGNAPGTRQGSGTDDVVTRQGSDPGPGSDDAPGDGEDGEPGSREE